MSYNIKRFFSHGIPNTEERQYGFRRRDSKKHSVGRPFREGILRDAFFELNNRRFPGNRLDLPAVGGVTWWIKQDEIHQATHVRGGFQFLPWHREIVNRLEQKVKIRYSLRHSLRTSGCSS